MINSINKKVFILISIVLYALFMFIDIVGVYDSTYIKYLAIVTCFVYAVVTKKKFFIISLFFTLLADFFLLVLDKYYIIGVMLFVIVQVTYIFYLSSLDIDTHLLLRLLIPLAFSILLTINNANSLLNILTVFYFSQLLVSCLSLLNNKKHKLFFIGLCLFVLCDICVGLHNIYPSNKLIALGQWFFYLPSQALIVLSD